MKWTDTREIAIALAEAHPGVDPERVAGRRFWRRFK
jgi:FeS assembly protein IscX